MIALVALGGQSVPPSVCVAMGGEQCDVWGKQMPCKDIPSYLRDVLHTPDDGRLFVAASAKTKQAEAEAQRVRELIRAAGYSHIAKGLGRCGLAAESP